MRFLLAGGVLGGAFLDARAQPLAWVGIVLLTWAFHRAKTQKEALIGGFVAVLAKQVVALHWLLSTCMEYFTLSPPLALGLCFASFFVSAVVLYAPMAVGVLVARHFSYLVVVPVRWWLPVAWAGGEVLLEKFSGASMGHFIHSQWAVQPVLLCLAYLGWFPTLLLGLYACSCVGDALALRVRWALVAPLIIVAFLQTLPPIPVTDDPLEGVAAMHLASAVQVPKEIPSGVDFVVWPEMSIRGKHRIVEGSLSAPVPLSVFTPISREHSLVGLTLKTSAGYLNAAGALDSEGNVLATRGKSVLVPFGERDFWGVSILDGEGFHAGREPPLLVVASRKVVPLICYEVFSRSLVIRGKKFGGEFLAVLASDRPFAGSRIALEQSLGVVVLRAVEFHLPAVRASLGGISALVSSDGRILAQGTPGTSKVLAYPLASTSASQQLLRVRSIDEGM